MSNTELWWGYKHHDGTLYALKFYSLEEMFGSEDHIHIAHSYGPFDALDESHAREVIEYLSREDN